MVGRSFVHLFPSSSLKSFLQKSASVWTQLPWRWGDEQQRACVHAYAYFFSFPPLLSSLAFSHFTSLPSLASASHDRRFAGPLRAPLFLSLNGRRRQGRSQMTENRCGRAFAGEGWMLLCTQVGRLGGHGLTLSSRCVHMPSFTALWMSWTLLPSNISVPSFQKEMPTVILWHTCFNVS